MVHRPKLTPEEARRDHRRMMRHLALNAAYGAALGIGLSATIVGFDLGGIASRIARSETPFLAFGLIAVPMAATFAAAVAASAVWLLPYTPKYAPDTARDQQDKRP